MTLELIKRFSAAVAPTLLLLPLTSAAQPSVLGPEAGMFQYVTSSAAAGTNPYTLASPIVLYDPTLQSPSVGQAINLVDRSVNVFTAKRSSSNFATNNASELNATNFWVFNNNTFWLTNFTAVNQPITFYAVARPRVVSGSNQNLFADPTAVFQIQSSGVPSLSGGTSISGGALAIRWYFIEGQLNGSSSFVKTNNATLIATGNAGAGALSGITVDSNNSQTQIASWDIAGMWFFNASESSATSTAVYQWATNRFGTQLQ